jgi:quercetin dioxygenase-like cupin family protein
MTRTIEITSAKPFTIISQVEAIEDELRKFPQVDLPVRHLFAEGVYARILEIPRGIILTGKIHKYSQLNVLLKGKVQVLINGKLEMVTAPFVIVSPAGTKRIIRAFEDSRWMTVHGTHETDVDKIEDQFIAQTEQEYLEHLQNEPFLPGF